MTARTPVPPAYGVSPALRGVIQSERLDPALRGLALWRRHLKTILRGFHVDGAPKRS